MQTLPADSPVADTVALLSERPDIGRDSISFLRDSLRYRLYKVHSGKLLTFRSEQECRFTILAMSVTAEAWGQYNQNDGQPFYVVPCLLVSIHVTSA